MGCVMQGIGVSGGYGLGRAFVTISETFQKDDNKQNNPTEQLERFRKASEEFVDNNNKLYQKLLETAGKKQADIIKSHINILSDPYVKTETQKGIENKKSAETAFGEVCDNFIKLFEASEDEMTRQRAADVKDVKNEILSILSGKNNADLSQLETDSVVFIKEITPSVVASIDKDKVSAIVSETGSQTSHASLLANAMGIPAVLGVGKFDENLKNSDFVIVDAFTGEIFVNPENDVIDSYKQKQKEFCENLNDLKKYISRKTKTLDGFDFELFGNIGNADEAKTVLENTADGIGLFRTEYLYMERHMPPGEQEQFEEYVKALKIMDTKPVIVRTLDIGADKEVSYFHQKKEENPYMGLRAIRYCMKNKEIFDCQLRALVRASAYGNLLVMIPLVTGLEELEFFKNQIKLIMREFDEKSVSYNPDMKLGVMIETPAAALTADLFAKYADFLSIGTNDLTGYTLSVDRGNADVSDIYSVFTSSVLREIKFVIDCAKKQKKSVSMCGKAAGDKRLIPLLVSFGLDKFSLSPNDILLARKTICCCDKKEADKLSKTVMGLESKEQIVNTLDEFIKRNKL